MISVNLNEEREFQVYLPPSYFFSDKNDYPVVYLMDGDYNFHYVTGVIELMSNVSGKMPECIVVGISDKGASKYRRNCTPNQIKEKDGNANNYMKFIENELKPFINNRYRTANYEIIIGHSIGGLFVTNFLLEKPDAFDAFIAIDPAFWPGDFEIINRADSTLNAFAKASVESNSDDLIQPLYYVSSSGALGMGIDKYVEILKKRFPDNENWCYFNLENENHNSVGLPTIKKSFEAIFNNWSISQSEFIAFDSADEVIDHYKELSSKYSSIVSIHPYFLGNIIYYYFNHEKKEDLLILENGIKEYFPGSMEEFYNQLALNHFENEAYGTALDYYNKSIEYNAHSFNAYKGLSKVYLAQNKHNEALVAGKKSIELAKYLNARQWMMNQLNANVEHIVAESAK